MNPSPNDVAAAVGRIPMFADLPIVASPILNGSKVAHKMFGRVYVSEAMFSLMKTANAAELEALLRSIKLKDHDPKPEHDLQWHMDNWRIIEAKYMQVKHGL